MPGVVSVQPRVGGLLSQVAQGVAIARDVYGIKHEGDMADLAQQKADQQKATFDQAQAGELPQAEKIAASRFGAFSAPSEDGSVPEGSALLKFTGDQGKTVYTPFKDSALVKAVGDGGSPVFKYVSRGDEVQAYEKPDKPDRAPAGKWAPVGFDKDGNPVSQNTVTGEYKAGDLGPVNKKGGAGLAPGEEAPPDPKAIAKEREGLKKSFIDGGQRSNIGVLQRKVMAANALETLLNAHPDGQIPPQFQSEIAAGVASLVMGGAAPTQGEIEKMDPQTRGTFTANLMQKLTNEPYNANNPGFMKLFGETIAREKATAQDMIGEKVVQAQSAAPNLFKADPKGFFGIVGMHPEDFDQSGGNFAYQPKMLGKKASPAAPEGGSGTAMAGPQLAPTKSGYMPGTVLDIDGVHYRVSDDGKTAVPVGRK